MKKISVLLYAVFFFSCSPSKEKVSPTAILISNVNIIDVDQGSVLEKRQLVIDSGLIKKIGESIDHPEAYTNVIQGKGKYLIPGLAEMHAHIPQPPTTDQRIKETLFLYLSNGITTIRGMLGHPSHLKLREDARD